MQQIEIEIEIEIGVAPRMFLIIRKNNCLKTQSSRHTVNKLMAGPFKQQK